jgi:hypothetical protein
MPIGFGCRIRVRPAHDRPGFVVRRVPARRATRHDARMSGPGATRGFTFQFAWAVASSLAALEGEGETLVVEGAEDVVDVQILGRDDRRLRVSQAKTRQEPHTWNPAALVDVIAAWMHLAEDDEARFEFVTDGSLGPSVVANLVPALRRASEGQLTEDDRAWLRERDLDTDASILGRVTCAVASHPLMSSERRGPASTALARSARRRHSRRSRGSRERALPSRLAAQRRGGRGRAATHPTGHRRYCRGPRRRHRRRSLPGSATSIRAAAMVARNASNAERASLNRGG